jgi:hypothetical protein
MTLTSHDGSVNCGVGVRQLINELIHHGFYHQLNESLPHNTSNPRERVSTPKR